jgi:prevent-host-death family protein
MKGEWKLQDAKARFSELVERALSDGPQHVTRRGVPAVVVVSEADYRKATSRRRRSGPGLLELMQRCPAPEVFEAIEAGRRELDFGREVRL